MPYLDDPPPPTFDEAAAALESAVQRRLDNFAKTRGYRNGIEGAISYKDSSVPHFRAEGEYCLSIRDRTWDEFHQIINEAEDIGGLPTLEEVLAELPTLEWPE
jgi:hypothetical protein